MARLIVVNVGISLWEEWNKYRQALQGLLRIPFPADNDLTALDTALINPQEAIERFENLQESSLEHRVAKALTEVMKTLWGSKDPRLTVHCGSPQRRNSCGELAGLSLMGIMPEDAIVLLYSETNSGAFCATTLEMMLQQGVVVPKGVSVEKRRIRGLQIDNLACFLEEGVVNYVLEIHNLYQNNHRADKRRDMVLNITGGYKGLIPYAGIVGMHFQIPICYLYEESDELLWLQPLAVTIAYADFFHSYWEAFKLICPPGTPPYPSQAFWSRITPSERDKVKPFVRDRDQKVELSSHAVLCYTLAYSKEQLPPKKSQGPLLPPPKGFE